MKTKIRHITICVVLINKQERSIKIHRVPVARIIRPDYKFTYYLN